MTTGLEALSHVLENDPSLGAPGGEGDQTSVLEKTRHDGFTVVRHVPTLERQTRVTQIRFSGVGFTRPVAT